MSEKRMPSSEQADVYNQVYDYFNDKLFGGKLKPCMLCFSRNKNIIGGYFSDNKWIDEHGDKVHEIALNANLMHEASASELYNVIVHEM